MYKRLFFVSLFISAIAGVFSYNATYALFSDTASSTNNSFSTATEFPQDSPSTPSASVVINEVSPIGGNSLDWIELFNKSGNPIDISGWKLRDNTLSDEIIPVNSVIPGNSYAVIVASGSSILVPGSALKIELTSSAIGNGLAQAGDRVILKDTSDSVIDQMSYGSDTLIFTIATPSSTQSLARDSISTDTDSATDWSLDITPSIGVGN